MAKVISAPDSEVVVGACGTGKSYYILYKILRSMIEGVPCCYIDPKGETYAALLAILSSTKKGREIYEALKHRILFLNPNSKSGYLLAFNAIEPLPEFEYEAPDLTALVANSIVSHIRRQSGFDVGEANRMQSIMAAAIGTLLEGGNGRYTLAEICYLFQQQFVPGLTQNEQPKMNSFVKSLLPYVDHYGTRLFWEQHWANWNANDRKAWVNSTDNRIFQYLFNRKVLYTLCTAKNSTLNFSKLVNDGYWLFVRIPAQTLDEQGTTILGNILLSKIFAACMQRGDGEKRYRLIIDEARFFNTGPLDMILDTANNLGLNLTLIVQNLEQLSRTHDGRVDFRLRDSIMTNCRFFSAFNSPNLSDREILQKLMFPATGELVTGIRSDGNYERMLPGPEEQMYQQAFVQLPKRRVILFDKYSGERPKTWTTPELNVPQIDQSKIAYFEGEHLRNTGTSVNDLEDEVAKRKKEIMEMMGVRISVEEARRIGPPLNLGN